MKLNINILAQLDDGSPYIGCCDYTIEQQLRNLVLDFGNKVKEIEGLDEKVLTLQFTSHSGSMWPLPNLIGE